MYSRGVKPNPIFIALTNKITEPKYIPKSTFTTVRLKDLVEIITN